MAPFGSLDPEVARDIALLREFAANRHRHMNRLLGRTLRHSPLRDELIRLILLSFATSRHQRLAFYVRACTAYATEPWVRVEVDRLVSEGLIILTRDELHPRALLINPTVKLIEFYNHYMARLRSEVTLLLSGEEYSRLDQA